MKVMAAAEGKPRFFAALSAKANGALAQLAMGGGVRIAPRTGTAGGGAPALQAGSQACCEQRRGQGGEVKARGAARDGKQRALSVRA